MKQTKTLCDCCGVEIEEREKNAIYFDLTVKIESDLGSRAKIQGAITLPNYDVCNHCIFTAIARTIDDQQVSAK